MPTQAQLAALPVRLCALLYFFWYIIASVDDNPACDAVEVSMYSADICDAVSAASVPIAFGKVVADTVPELVAEDGRNTVLSAIIRTREFGIAWFSLDGARFPLDGASDFDTHSSSTRTNPDVEMVFRAVICYMHRCVSTHTYLKTQQNAPFQFGHLGVVS